MSDIVERLAAVRDETRFRSDGMGLLGGYCGQAADEIERLRSRVMELEAELRPWRSARNRVNCAGVSEWRNLDTVPKDGSDILLWFPDEEACVIAAWQDTPPYPWVMMDGMVAYHENTPAHWMPLPAPPRNRENCAGAA